MVQAGVFEANPTLVNKNGFDWSTAGAIGTVTIGEFWYTPGAAPGILPGHYKLGAYYSSANAPDLYFDAEGRPTSSRASRRSSTPARAAFTFWRTRS